MCNFSKKSEGKVTTNMFLYLSKKLIEMYRQKLIRIVRVKSPERTMGLGPHIEFDHVRGEGVGTKRAPGPILMGPNLFKRRSEEDCLLGRTKYGSNTPLASNKDSPQ